MGESYVMNEKRRGFASMSPEVVREIARKGGIACHVSKTGHEWTKEEASIAGRKGGKESGRRRNERQNQEDSYR